MQSKDPTICGLPWRLEERRRQHDGCVRLSVADTARAHAEVRRHGPPTGLDEIVLQRRDLTCAWLNADAVAQLPESMVALCFDDGDASHESVRKYEDAGHRRRALDFDV